MAAAPHKVYNDLTPRWLALAATVVALALRFYRLDFQSLWWDEGISLYLSGQGLDALVFAKDFALDLHPPLYHVLLAGWTAVLGADPFTARAFSAVLGAANVPLLYLVVRRLAGPGAGAAAAWLLAVSPLHIFYSQEVRMYSLVPLLATGSMLTFIWLVDSAGRHRWWAAAGYVASTAAGLWAYYYIGLLVIAQNAFFALLWLRQRQGLRWWVGAQGGTAFAFAGWGLVLANMVLTTDLWVVKEGAFAVADLAGFLRTFATAFAVGFTAGDAWGPILTAAFLALAALGLLHGGTRDWEGRALLVLWLVVPVLIAYAIATQRAFVFPRFVIFSALALYGLAGAGIALLARRLLPASVVAFAVLLASSAWSLYGHYTVPRTAYAASDYLVPLGEIRVAAAPRDLVISDQAWAAGYARSYLGNPRPSLLWTPPTWAKGPNVAERELQGLVDRHGRIWVLSWLEGGTWRGSHLENALAKVATPLFVDQFGEFRLRLFARAGEAAPQAMLGSRTDTLGTYVRLTGYQREPAGTLSSGGRLDVNLTWLSLSRDDVSRTVFVQLLGPDGRLYGQKDNPPVNGTHPTNIWQPGELVRDRYTLSIAKDAPAGEYRLIAGMYDAATGKRLPVGESDHIVLERLTLGSP